MLMVGFCLLLFLENIHLTSFVTRGRNNETQDLLFDKWLHHCYSSLSNFNTKVKTETASSFSVKILIVNICISRAVISSKIIID